MNAHDIEKLRHKTVTSVLLTRGGWVHAGGIRISPSGDWRTIDGQPTLWKISLYSESRLLLRDLYVESETIAGISVENKTHDQAPQQRDESTPQADSLVRR